MNAAEQAQRFAAALLGDYGNLLDGLRITLSTFPGPSTRWLPAQPGALAPAIITSSRQPGTKGVYAGVGLTRGTPSDAKRLVVADAAALTWLWADIDVAGKAHGYDRSYPPDKQTAVEIARSTGLEPTVVVDTGHGIQAHWRLRDPFIFGWVGEVDDDGHPIIDLTRVDADREKAKTLAWEWFTSLRVRAQRMGGYFLDPVGDLARLVRCPGSTNRKIDGDPRRVMLLDVDRTREYELDQIEQVLAPEELLRPYRSARRGDDSVLDGIDLPGLWAAARQLPDHVPDWLSELIESGWADDLARIWDGRENARFHNDDSTVDMALVGWILRNELGAERAVEAVMCRRLRVGRALAAAGVSATEIRKKVDDKVDPARRTTYLDMTIGKAAASLREDTERTASAQEALTVATTGTGDAGGDPPSDPEPDPSPGGGATPSEEAVPGEPVDPPRPSLRAAPCPAPDPRQEYADAPAAPRQGLDDSTPGPPSGTEVTRCAQLTAMLGMPTDVTVWAVGMRRLADIDQFRIWCHRGPDAVVYGGSWPVGRLKATRWRPKSEWNARATVEDNLLYDLHISAAPAQKWRSEGRPLLYALARNMPEGTPLEIVRLAAIELLHGAAGTSHFEVCQTSGEPWVTDTEVWVRLAAIKDEISRGGIALGSKGTTLVDVLCDAGCRVKGPMTVTREHRQITDYRQWVRLNPDLAPPEFWTNVRDRAAQTDADIRRARIMTVRAGDGS